MCWQYQIMTLRMQKQSQKSGRNGTLKGPEKERIQDDGFKKHWNVCPSPEDCLALGLWPLLGRVTVSYQDILTVKGVSMLEELM